MVSYLKNNNTLIPLVGGNHLPAVCMLDVPRVMKLTDSGNINRPQQSHCTLNISNTCENIEAVLVSNEIARVQNV